MLHQTTNTIRYGTQAPNTIHVPISFLWVGLCNLEGKSCDGFVFCTQLIFIFSQLMLKLLNKVLFLKKISWDLFHLLHVKIGGDTCDMILNEKYFNKWLKYCVRLWTHLMKTVIIIESMINTI